MARMRRIGVEERRARMAARHALAPAARVRDPADAARAVVVLHATDPATVHLSAMARMAVPEVAAVERALYEERALVRMLGMRRTMFAVPRELVAHVHASSTRAVAAAERRRLVRRLEAAGVAGDPARWLRRAERAALAALAARGEATAAELAADVPALRTWVITSPGRSYEARQNVTTWVLSLLAADGRIVRTRPRGTWRSGQHRWTSLEAWLPDGIPAVPRPAAQAELARRWLARFGPATVADVRWWTGWTAADCRAALRAIGAAEVDLDGVPGVALADDLEPAPRPEPWAALLPALDATPMGWSERDWFLGPHRPRLFDGNGNAGPTAWWDGRVVGGWGQRPDGEVVVRLLEDVGADARSAMAAEAERLTAALGGSRVIPRFRTPLEREIAEG